MPLTWPATFSCERWNLSGKPHRLRYGKASCVSVAVPTQSLGWTFSAACHLAQAAATMARPSMPLGRPDEGAQLVVAEHDHVVGLVQHAHLDELLADGDEHEADVRVGALVDVEVMVRGQRRHLEVDLVGGAHLLERLALESLEDLHRGRVDVGLELGDGGGVVVVRRRTGRAPAG